MAPIGIPSLNVVSEHPIPFISTGNPREKRALDKIARFTHNFVICGRVTTESEGCYAPRDLECWSISRLEWKSGFWVGLRSGFGWRSRDYTGNIGNNRLHRAIYHPFSGNQ